MRKPNVLVVDGDEDLRRSVRMELLRHGNEVLEVQARADVLRCVREWAPDLVIIGSSSDRSWVGLEVVQDIRLVEKTLPLILVMPESTEASAVAALKARVNDYLRPPFSFDELIGSVNRCLSDAGTFGPSVMPHGESSAGLAVQPMIGQSQSLRTIIAYIAKVAAADSNVLITGETGTGKELAAELLHRKSRRAHRSLVRINCAAIPDSLLESELFGYERGAFTGAHAAYEGKLKLAAGGTVFFDEIGEMSLYAQAKILRVIETREAYRLGGNKSIPLDVRIVAATNQNLEPLVAEGKFRKDLYFRLSVVRIHLPPLRERTQDIPALVEHYVEELDRRLSAQIAGVTPDALEALARYDWPGNVRELKNVLEAVAVEFPVGEISLGKLPTHVRRSVTGPEMDSTRASGSSERERLLSALLLTNWNKCRAAKELRWSRMTLYRKMAKYRVALSRTQELEAAPGEDVTAGASVTNVSE